MTRPVRLGAVNYLNVRPLVYGLSALPERVLVRFDAPAECARLLASHDIDLGMVPSIAYLDRPGDRAVPGVCIGSDGPVASVALFTRKPVSEVRTIALDASSRTSVVLTQIICRRQFGIAPVFTTRPPNLDAMLSAADAALLIGDIALFVDHRAHGAEKIDLGGVWSAMTGLPFVWAFWAGRAEAADREVVSWLQDAATRGLMATDAIAADYCAGDPARTSVARQYLRENLTYRFDERALEGLRAYYREAAALRLVDAVGDVTFY